MDLVSVYIWQFVFVLWQRRGNGQREQMEELKGFNGTVIKEKSGSY